MSIRRHDLVLVVDGERATCFLSELERSGHLYEVWHCERKARMDRELARDRPGRYQHGLGLPRSSYEIHSGHDADIIRFIRALSKPLEDLIRQSGCDQLVIVAPPPTLGLIREIFPDHLRRLIRREIVRDYTRTPRARLEQLLKGALEANPRS